MSFKKVLIANRGEIAVRISRALSEMELASVAVFAEDDAHSSHVMCCDESASLAGSGPASYLDIEAMIAAAIRTGCDAVHPGYGFLSENAGFARRVAGAGLTFIGPRPEHLELFGDKTQARQLASRCRVPLLEGTGEPTSLPEARAFLHRLGPGNAMMIKALHGGGGRGMRVVRSEDELDHAYERCQSEARAAFGNPDLYVERFMPFARHVEVQIIGDGSSAVHVGERDCTVQRRNQKLIETAPASGIPAHVRDRLHEASLSMAREVEYASLATFEYLVDADDPERFAFMEVNPRIQVEHTVTEEVYAIDLVKAQIRVAAGARLADLGLSSAPSPRGYAMQLRINMEEMLPDGTAKPSGGTIRRFRPPSGPGIRVDTFAYEGYRTTARYDSLLAKLIVFSADGEADACRRADRALREFAIEGVATNIPVLQRTLADSEFRSGRISTRFFEQKLPGWLREIAEAGPQTGDPLKLFAGPRDAAGRSGVSATVVVPEGAEGIRSPLLGTIVSIDIAPGDRVRRGQQIAVIEAMKMEHAVAATSAGVVSSIEAAVGETISEGALIAILQIEAEEGTCDEHRDAVDLELIRTDLADVLVRQSALDDSSRPDAVARRRKTNQRTVRENIADLCDTESFIEYGGLALAAQRHRRSISDLHALSPADGMVAGIGSVNGALFDHEETRCAVFGYDYTVFAGTQGVVNHAKKDRVLTLAERWRLPVILFAEGGGGRPGDAWPTPATLETPTFARFGKLNGRVPTIGVVSGRCFAGNAALLGSSDVIIAARGSNIGMGGPAMVEGGGLGIFRPEDIGPIDVQVPNGVVDIEVSDEAEGVRAAKQYLSYFQGALNQWSCGDQRTLRHLVPENRMRSYDVRRIIEALADTGTVLELRSAFGIGMITALARIEGRPVGIVANNSLHLGGAIDADGSDKMARFIQLCDAFDLPIVSLCDTPGMMVGPDVEKTAQVRHVSRLFVAASGARVPFFTVVLRKAYGLGALAMTAGNANESFFIVSWPSGEFGPMGLEGAVKLAYRKELDAIEDPVARKAWFDDRVSKSYEENKALNNATYFAIDDVIDPARTRTWIASGLKTVSAELKRGPRRVTRIDTW